MTFKSILSLSTSALSCLLSLSTRASQKPNIVLVMADDIGHECYGLNGSNQYKTPFLDKLASKSLYFNHAYSNPVCTPSRNKIMTGLSNIRNYSAFFQLHPEAAKDNFAIMLKNAGYKTCVAGKWQLNGVKETAYTGVSPKEAGFDESYCWFVKKTDYDNRYWEPKLEENGKYIEYPKDKYGPDILTDRINDFIRRHKNEPFFVYYPMVLVHAPFVPTPDSTDKNCTNEQRNFEDMVSYMDKMIHKVVSQIEKENLSENTLIIVTADNGTHPRIFSKFKGRVIKGGKGKPTDAGTRVAFMASWKGKSVAGKRIDDLIDFGDVYATLAEVAGVKLNKERSVDSVSFLPQILGEKGEKRDSIYVCNYGKQKTPTIFARNQRYKLYSTGKFYDILNDVDEKKNLSQKKLSPLEKEVKAKLQEKIDFMPKKSPLLGPINDSQKPKKKETKKKENRK